MILALPLPLSSFCFPASKTCLGIITGAGACFVGEVLGIYLYTYLVDLLFLQALGGGDVLLVTLGAGCDCGVYLCLGSHICVLPW